MTPLTVELTLAIQQELQARMAEADRLRRQQVERARYEAELARRRYLRVDPDHRLVAAELEAQWNQALRAVTAAQDVYEQQRQADGPVTDQERAALLQVVTDFPRLWHHPQTPDRERKRMVRLLVDDVTLVKTAVGLTAHVRFRGGATSSLHLPPALSAWQLRQTSPQVVALIDQRLDDHTAGQIAAQLNADGYVSGAGRAFHRLLVERLRRNYQLRSRYDRLRARGLLTIEETAHLLGVKPVTVKAWARHGLLIAHAYSDKPEYLYEHPGDQPPTRMQGRKLSHRARHKVLTNRTQEVQCEA